MNRIYNFSILLVYFLSFYYRRQDTHSFSLFTINLCVLVTFWYYDYELTIVFAYYITIICLSLTKIVYYIVYIGITSNYAERSMP